MAGDSTTKRGYGTAHQILRKKWQGKVDAGEVNCARCGEHIEPGTKWDLGHDDNDRTKYNGPECVPCNRGTGARNATEARLANQHTVSREW